MNRRYGYIWTRAIQCFAAIISFVIVYFKVLHNPPSTISNNINLFEAIFYLLASIVLIERAGAVATGYFRDKEREDLASQNDKILSSFLDNHIITFSTASKGSEHCISRCGAARHIKNTVLRYGNSHPISGKGIAGESNYARWLDVKEKSLAEGNCKWEELVSSYISREDRQLKIMDEYHKQHHYDPRMVDDKKYSLVQMTIFYFNDTNVEVIFGWEFPGGMQKGACFLTANRDIVKYFETYFDHHYHNKDIAKPYSNKSILSF